MSDRPLGLPVLGKLQKRTTGRKLQIRCWVPVVPTVTPVAGWCLDYLRGVQRRNWLFCLVQVRGTVSSSVEWRFTPLLTEGPGRALGWSLGKMDEKGVRRSRGEKEQGGRWGKDALESSHLAVGS